jgi:hypothetical protein
MRTTDASLPKESRPDHCEHAALFGPPPLLEGEDPKTYDQFLTESSAAVMPADILEQILVRDYVDLTIQVLRLRRIEANLIRVNAYKGLVEVLKPLVGHSQAESLAEGWAACKPEIVEEVNKTLKSAGLNTDTIMAQTFSVKLDDIERLEHLIALAETRRNAALRGIYLHRQTLAQKLRRAAQRLEDDQTRLIESAPIDGTNAK